MLSPRPLPDRLPSLVPLDPEEEALLRGCLACPWDDASFLVYADWLEEHQQTERADFVRLQVARGGRPDRWYQAPPAVRAWTGQVFSTEWHNWLQFSRGLPGILNIRIAQIGDLSSPALAGWIWGLHSDGQGPEVARVLASGPQLSSLTFLDMGYNEIRAEGAQVLAASSHLTRLTYLDLSNNVIQDKGAQALAACPRLASLASLYLWNDQIGEAGAQALAASPHLARLVHLELGFNALGDAGAEALAASPHLARLTALHLGSNGIGDAGAQALAASPHLARLTSLELNGNQISDEGAWALAGSPWLGQLASLSLGDNPIGAEGAQALRQSASLRGCKIHGIA
jgi:uncharacterized protein (TIGR02996 family)